MKMKLLTVGRKQSPEVVDIKPSNAIFSSEKSCSCCCCNQGKLFRSINCPGQQFTVTNKLLPASCCRKRVTTLRASLVGVLIVLQILLAGNSMIFSKHLRAVRSIAEAAESSLVGAQDVARSADDSQQQLSQRRFADVQVLGASKGAVQEGDTMGPPRTNTELDNEEEDNGEDGSRRRQNIESSGDGRRRHSELRLLEGSLKNKMKTLDEFLESLPTLSVGQKHTARFECELNKETAAAADSSSKPTQTQLVWVKLTRRSELPAVEGVASNSSAMIAEAIQAQQEHDTKVISLNQKLITPDKRFKVRRQSPIKWILSIDNVGPDDNHAYYLCQSAQQVNSAAERLRASKQQSAAADLPGRKFVGGARLNVLVPPKIVEQETSASLVQANEFEQLSLKCKVISEPQSQLMWKREDGRTLGGLEQRFRHEFERKPSQILSIDSSELVFESITRQNAGAYLCIASNGVQPGVSQRMSVSVVKCRAGPELSAASEACEEPEEPSRPGAEIEPATNTTPARTKSWKTTKQTSSELQRRQQRLLQADKRRANGRANADHNSINRNGLDGKSELAKDSSTATLLQTPFCSYLCALVTTIAVAGALVASP